ncbi:HD domain-containing protein [Asticcacaulis excentricus]|uniref:N-methyl-D-aspartate receptor NMDAR2C subunit n=1 Tax=Asticcacaulis excentricus (strain ATCC 15261 / DSM 4724 / KCTC 12464 / NCIMB 9791 / VKM B-1370 / CB 48) TaxID=573065 RepID=E8RQ96_ASTEC|nr:hypothetical protein [Asticcacaulis excentricus]ADU13198.1 hypothetical protein Astex_1532 [Asticcacaulis excentricus CB 48]
MVQLSDRWNDLAARLGWPDRLSVETWQWLATQYQEPHRYYHRLSHISAMFDGGGGLFWREPDAVALAIFFHDVIYDPARVDNEMRSAEATYQRLSDCLDVSLLDKVAALIEATKTHRGTGDTDTDQFLDLDMAILGASWADYALYADGVRQEYEPVYGIETYRMGRVTRFIEPMLATERLFLTPAFQPLDTKARANLQRELATLRR